MIDWTRLPEYEILSKTIKALTARGINVKIAETVEDAKKMFFQIVPEGAEVLLGNSMSLVQCGISERLNNGKYVNLRSDIDAIKDDDERTLARRKLKGPEFGAGSVHAITEEGQLVIASSSGSQLGFYVYGAAKLILVVGMQKIVKDLDEAMERINKYALPLVNEDVYNRYEIARGVAVNKILTIERETTPNRITIILVKQNVGF